MHKKKSIKLLMPFELGLFQFIIRLYADSRDHRNISEAPGCLKTIGVTIKCYMSAGDASVHHTHFLNSMTLVT